MLTQMPDPLSAPSGLHYRGSPLTPSLYTLGFPGDEEDSFGPFMVPTQTTGRTGVHPRSTVHVAILMPSFLVTDTDAISMQSATRIIANAPQQCLQCSTTITNAVTSTKSHQAPSNNDLLTGSVRTFTVHFIPILWKYIGSLENPWVTDVSQSEVLGWFYNPNTTPKRQRESCGLPARNWTGVALKGVLHQGD